jgi:hypothetical protein
VALELPGSERAGTGKRTGSGSRARQLANELIVAPVLASGKSAEVNSLEVNDRYTSGATSAAHDPLQKPRCSKLPYRPVSSNELNDGNRVADHIAMS